MSKTVVFEHALKLLKATKRAQKALLSDTQKSQLFGFIIAISFRSKFLRIKPSRALRGVVQFEIFDF